MTLVLKPRTTRHRLTMGVLAVAAAVLLSGCPPQEPADGNYPTLEAALAAIDWVGDGSVSGGGGVRPGGDKLPILTVRSYRTDDPVALPLEIENRLKSFDTVFTLISDRATTGTFEADDLEIYVGASSSFVALRIQTLADDDAAVKSLEPVVEVLGTIPHHPSWDEHPRLEAALATIDWTGDGIISGDGGVRPGDDELPIETAVPYRTTEPEVLEVKIENRLRSFDLVFTPIGDSAGSTIFEADNLKIYVPNTGRSPVVIWVATLADEDAAIESLEAVIEALGTIP